MKPRRRSGRKVTAERTPYEVIYEEGTLKVLRYRRRSASRFAEPLLICFALVNRPYILDLRPDRSVVRQLLRKGFEVYLIDWGVPRPADCRLQLEDYVCGFMKNVANAVCRQAGVERVNLMGYCMGGTMSTMFASLYQQQVRNLILLAAPLDFQVSPGLLNLWASEKYFDVDGLIDAFGNCPGSFLQAAFQITRPVDNFHKKYIGLFEKLDDEQARENFYAMERWCGDSIPVAGETFREFVTRLYRRNQLVKGEMTLRGAPLDLRRISCPLLLLVAENDHLVPPQSTLALRDCVSSADVKVIKIKAGHIGLAVGSAAHQRLWPAAAEWLADRSPPRR